MAANTITSTGNTVAGTDPNFTINHKIQNWKDGVVVYVDYTVGTSAGLTLTFKAINPNISTTSLYQIEQVAADGSVAAVTFTIGAANGKYRLALPLRLGEKEVQVVAVFGSSGKDGAAVIDFQDN